MKPRSTKRKPLSPQERRAGVLMLLIAFLPVAAIFIATETVSDAALQRFMAAFAALAFLGISIYSLRQAMRDMDAEAFGTRLLHFIPGVFGLIAAALFAVRFYWLGTQSVMQP